MRWTNFFIALYVFQFFSAKGEPLPGYNIIQFDKTNGLKQEYIYALTQDDRGFLWIGTGAGAYRYSGYEFKHYLDSSGLTENFITATANDHGQLFFGFFNGSIATYSDRAINLVYTPADGESKVVGFVRHRTGVWGALQDGSLIHIQGSRAKQLRNMLPPGTVVTSISCLGDWFLLGTTEGLFYASVQGKELSTFAQLNDFAYKSITCLEADLSGGKIWVGSRDQGICTIMPDEESFKVFHPFKNRFEDVNITCLKKQAGGPLWVGTKFQGVTWLDLNHQDQIQNSRQLNGETGFPNSINVIFEDAMGSTWVGSVGRGLLQLVPNTFSFYDLAPLSATEIFGAITLDSVQMLLSTDIGFIQASYSPKRGKFVFKDAENPLFETSSLHILSNSNTNTGLITNEQGDLYQYDSYQQSAKQLLKSLGGQIRVAMIDQYDHPWLAVKGQGVYKLSGDYKTILAHYNTSNGFIHNEVFALSADKENNIWVGTHGAGLAKLNTQGEWEYLSQQDKFLAKDVNDIITGADGKVWIATDGMGLFCFTGNEFVQFTDDQGLFSNYCSKLIEHNEGVVWVMHRDGLSKVICTDFRIKSYSRHSGIPSFDYNSKVVLKGPQNGLWFISGANLVRWNAPPLSENLSYPRAYFTDLKIFYTEEDLRPYMPLKNIDRLVYLPQNLVFPYDKNHLTFEYAAVNLKNDNRYYQAKLFGYDQQWSPITRKTSVTYTNLPPGDYQLAIKTSDTEYSWPVQVESLEFTITKPYWQRWWFYLVQVAAVILLLSATFHLSKYNSNKKKDKWILRIMVYVCLFIMFEYLQSFLEPYTQDYIGGAPVFKILINLVLALILFPVESLVKAYFYSNEKKQASYET